MHFNGSNAMDSTHSHPSSRGRRAVLSEIVQGAIVPADAVPPTCWPTARQLSGRSAQMGPASTPTETALRRARRQRPRRPCSCDFPAQAQPLRCIGRLRLHPLRRSSAQPWSARRETAVHFAILTQGPARAPGCDTTTGEANSLEQQQDWPLARTVSHLAQALGLYGRAAWPGLKVRS
jgi:hypothetical protein